MKITKNKNGGLTIDGLGRTIIHLVEGVDGSAENFSVEFPETELTGVNYPNNELTGFTVYYHKDEETRNKAVNTIWE